MQGLNHANCLLYLQAALVSMKYPLFKFFHKPGGGLQDIKSIINVLVNLCVHMGTLFLV